MSVADTVKFDAIVDEFAAAMKARFAEKEVAGKSGWDQPQAFGRVQRMLRKRVDRGDAHRRAVDVANLAAMLWSHMGGEAGQGVQPGDVFAARIPVKLTKKFLHSSPDLFREVLRNRPNLPVFLHTATRYRFVLIVPGLPDDPGLRDELDCVEGVTEPAKVFELGDRPLTDYVLFLEK